MLESDPFDRRLAKALRRYATDAPTIGDPAGFAGAIARQHPRRARWLDAVVSPAGRRLVWIVVVVALVVVSLVLLAGVGSSRPELPLAMPDAMFGGYRATVSAAGEQVPAGDYTLDVNDASLLRGPEGEPLAWAGVARAVVSTPAGGLDLEIRGSLLCGDARYAIRLEGDDPDPSPGPSASGGNPTPDPSALPLQRLGDGEAFRLVPVAESCGDRRSILTSGPWSHPTIEMTAGETYGSIDFTEPFTFVFPTSKAEVKSLEQPWGKGILRLGNSYDWRGYFVDDVELGADQCHPDRGTLADIPATPAEVEAWLRSSPGLRVGDAVQLAVDGRIALAIPVEFVDCEDFFTGPQRRGTFYFGSHARIYAIPTGDDLILFSATSWGMPDLDDVTDELIRSIRFQ
jgi:hypothetical protein